MFERVIASLPALNQTLRAVLAPYGDAFLFQSKATYGMDLPWGSQRIHGGCKG